MAADVDEELYLDRLSEAREEERLEAARCQFGAYSDVECLECSEVVEVLFDERTDEPWSDLDRCTACGAPACRREAV